MKSIILICFLAFTLCTALPIQNIRTLKTRTDLEAETDRLLFSASIEEFEAARDAQDPPELDWTSDGCTASPDVPLGFNFQPSCQRHDFAYQNYEAQNRFTADAKTKIDLNFKSDMLNECGTHGSVGESVCDGVANIYYSAVKLLGGVNDIQRRVAKSEAWRAISHPHRR